MGGVRCHGEKKPRGKGDGKLAEQRDGSHRLVMHTSVGHEDIADGSTGERSERDEMQMSLPNLCWVHANWSEIRGDLYQSCTEQILR